VNDLKIPGFDVVDDVEHPDPSEHERTERTDRRRRWISGSAALGVLAFGITAGMIALLILVGTSMGAFGAVGGCGGG